MQGQVISQRASRGSVCQKSAQTTRVSRLNTVVCHAGRKFFVGGNWKSNGSKASVADLVKSLNSGASSVDAKSVEVVVAPPAIYLDSVSKSIDGSLFKVSAQNCSLTGPGAFTGEIAAEHLVDSGIPWVITGHSERRSLFGETNEIVGKKTARALEKGLSVIPCIGETLEQRQSGNMFKILEGQVQALIDNVKDWSKVVVAYEPVWAIGTGVVASPEQAQEVHAYLRKLFTEKLGKQVADGLRILYGGSVTDANCVELAKKQDIDGFLVGGASLKGPAFITICKAAKAAAK